MNKKNGWVRLGLASTKSLNSQNTVWRPGSGQKGLFRIVDVDVISTWERDIYEELKDSERVLRHTCRIHKEDNSLYPKVLSES